MPGEFEGGELSIEVVRPSHRGPETLSPEVWKKLTYEIHTHFCSRGVYFGFSTEGAPIIHPEGVPAAARRLRY